MRKSKDSGKKKWVDPDDAPELTREFFQRADIYEGDKLIRRGRPPPGGWTKPNGAIVRRRRC